MTQLDALVALSRKYGSDPDWVLAGGGNTSWKDSSRLYVKASGTSLGDISADGFCAIDRSKLDAIWTASYPSDPEAREAAVLADLMAARAAAAASAVTETASFAPAAASSKSETKRPSVETLMHGLFPQSFVVHTHPALVNGLACGMRGHDVFQELFEHEAIWIPFVDPGYVLAQTVRGAMDEYRSREGRDPSIMIMQNHGLLVAGESPAEIDSLSRSVVERIRPRIQREPDFSAVSIDAEAMFTTLNEIKALAPAGSSIRFRADAETFSHASSENSFAPLSSAFTPDHIVYAGHEFLRADPGRIAAAWEKYRARNSIDPRIVVAAGVGAFSIAASGSAADRALLLYVDACKIAAYAESFGGARHMTKDKIDFIRNWEVEKYRSKVAMGNEVNIK